MAQLEIACFNVKSALIAQENGVDRVELCDGIFVGGTTPSIKMVQQARKELTVDLYVMIRPRGGDFVYTAAEFEAMKAAVISVKKENVDGFVFGILNKDKTINVTQNAELIALANPFPCTFHRAFDEVEDVFQSLEQIIACGFSTILTSGQAQSVTNGMSCLTELVSKANNRITIMPGGGLRSSNIESIRQNTRAVYFHSSAITDGGETANADEIQALKSKLK